MLNPLPLSESISEIRATAEHRARIDRLETDVAGLQESVKELEKGLSHLKGVVTTLCWGLGIGIPLVSAILFAILIPFQLDDAA